MKKQGSCVWKPVFAGMAWMCLVLSANAATIVVNSLDDSEGSTSVVTLRWAINQVNAAPSTTDTLIDMSGVSGYIILISDLPPIRYNTVIKGSTVNSLTIHGGGAHRIFSVLSGKLTINNLILTKAFAKGGNGGKGLGLCGGGGGGAGMGAALFVNQNAEANCVNVVFDGNEVRGGNGETAYSGGYPYDSWPGSGGGFAGDGSTAKSMGGIAGGSGGMLGSEGEGGWAYNYYNSSTMGGGFGGGGGAGSYPHNIGGSGGFGGGGGAYSNDGSSGTPGQGGFFGGKSSGLYGGGGAGLGGAIFVRDDARLVLENCTFKGNAAHHGVGGNNGQGKGGAIFARNGGIVKVKGTITFDSVNKNTADDSADPTVSFDTSLFGQNLDIPEVRGVLHFVDDTTAFPPSAASNWPLYR